MNEKIIEAKLSYIITGLCFKVHKELGRFSREKQYSDKFEELLKKSKIKYHRENGIVDRTNSVLSGNIVDFLVENKIVVEIKAKKFLTKDDYYQVQRYLQSSGLELGIIFNFRNTYLNPKRILNHALFKDKKSQD